MMQSGSGMMQTDVSGISAHIKSSQAFLNLPMGSWAEQDGTALAGFASGDSTTPGISAGDESFGVRWNNHANPDPISMSVPIPPDLDASQDVVVHMLYAQTGANDTITWTVGAFNNVVNVDYQGDADFGGATAGNAPETNTTVEATRTLAAANVTGSPCVLVLTLQPTAGTLGTDDAILLGVWLEYTRKTLTS